MKKILSFLLAAVTIFSVTVTSVSGRSEAAIGYAATMLFSEEVPQSENQAVNVTGGVFKTIFDFIRSLFYSKITFDTDGGNEIEDAYFLKWKKAPRPADPVKEGYTFDGWEPEIPNKAVWRDLAVKAKWQVNYHDVYWVIDGATVKKETYAFGSEIERFTPAEKKGYVLSAWNAIPETMPDEDVTICATWLIDDSKAPEIVVAKNTEEFLDAASGLVALTLSDANFDAQEALNDQYYTKRLIVSCNDFSQLDFHACGADFVLMNDDGLMILQFDDEELTKECEQYLSALSCIEIVETDACFSIEDEISAASFSGESNSNWGKNYIKAVEYARYLENCDYDKLTKVAVLDTGIDKDHPNLKGRILNGRDIVENDDSPEDGHGHGTHVSGIIVDCTPRLNVKILPIKVLTDEGRSTKSSLLLGIMYAKDQGAQVINLSLGGEARRGDYLCEEKEINKAVDKGAAVVVAAGNDGQDTREYFPARMNNEVIVVAALNSNGERAYFSNYGNSVDVIAPGVNVYSSYPGERYGYMSGTSQATPHISAVAAMFKLSHPDCTPAELEDLIKQYCADLGPQGRDDYYGFGCPNLYNAVPDCVLSFESNGGSRADPITTKSASTVVLPSISKSYSVTLNANGGYVSSASVIRNCAFEGWYESAYLSGNRLSAGESYMVLKNKTLYAKWRNPTLGRVQSPSRTGYCFDGWHTAANGGIKYKNITEISGDVTLYAHWSQRVLVYNANGGSGAPPSQKGYGSTRLSQTEPNRQGYQFLGWSPSASASTPSYGAGGTVDLYENLTLYAVWGKASVTLSRYSGVQQIVGSPENGLTKQQKPYNGGWYFAVSLPDVFYSNVADGSGKTGWYAEPGSVGVVGFDDEYMYVSQPGKIKIRYWKNGYPSDIYTHDLSLYKITSATNWIRPTPAGDGKKNGKYRCIGEIPRGVKVQINNIDHNGIYELDGVQKKAAFGYVTYEGTSGWIILWHFK